jgi:NADH-quinone oxidoreductase subunit G
MGKTVTLRIDDQTVTVPEGMLVVDAAKQIGNDIPVFCYHPKMEPVGMCRMCLVSIGRPARDRATNELVLEDDGSPKIVFGPKLETACTTPVSEGMVVVTTTDAVTAARKEVLEFLLTSHPLDCPICDKGGECPLQNLTMGYGPGQSRFLFDEKMRLAKHYPLGELIVLDRERCIQCARCVRFQDDIAGDPVIGFSQRGRALEIVTYSEPGFDSYFSGNTTDICPVGALTTVDFRFKARPWELKAAAGICNHCPVGCNLTYNVRREVMSGGGASIKRVMPRQNEAVNEIWICDKGRFAYQYTESPQRLKTPLIRKNGELVEATWEEALERVAAGFDSDQMLVTLAGGRLSNEDLFNLHQLTTKLGGQAVLDTHMGGGDLTSLVGVSAGTNFGEMGPETAILVTACDLLEEAPVWFLRVKQAAERGAKLIVVNPRPTKLDRYAAHVVHYAYGQESNMLSAFRTR